MPKSIILLSINLYIWSNPREKPQPLIKNILMEVLFLSEKNPTPNPDRCRFFTIGFYAGRKKTRKESRQGSMKKKNRKILPDMFPIFIGFNSSFSFLLVHFPSLSAKSGPYYQSQCKKPTLVSTPNPLPALRATVYTHL